MLINEQVIGSTNIQLSLYDYFEEAIAQQSVQKNNNKVKQLKGKLSSHGVDMKWFDTTIDKHTTDIKKQSSVEKAIDTAVKAFVSFSNEFRGKYGNVAASAMLLFIVVAINTFLFNIIITALLLGGVSGPMAMTIAAATVAPLVEETAKFISIKAGATKEFFMVFNVIEFMKYVIMMTLTGIGIIPAMILRLTAVIMHGSTTKIQSLFVKEFPKEPKKQMIGLGIGIAIHAIWNFMAGLKDEQVAEIVGHF